MKKTARGVNGGRGVRTMSPIENDLTSLYETNIGSASPIDSVSSGSRGKKRYFEKGEVWARTQEDTMWD